MKTLRSFLLPAFLSIAAYTPAATGPVISEFMAFNVARPGALLDEDNESSDWIEIQNLDSSSANLLDWSLTDDPGNPNKWRFPATNMPAGGFLVVFASEKNRRIPGAPLHTNFRLGGSGEYLALVRPDGSIASEFAPFPPQVPGVSFGLGVLSSNSTLVATSSPVRVQVPADGNDGTNWLYPGFNDDSWTAGTNGVGYGTTNVTAVDYSAAVLPTGPVAYWRLNEASGTVAANLGSGAGLNGAYTGTTLGTSGPRPPQFIGFESNNNAPTFTPASSSYVTVPSPLLNNRSSFTMAGWIKPAAGQAARTGLFGQNDCVEFGFISASGLQLWTFFGSIDFAYPFAFGQWHHIAAVGTGSQLQLYLDGTLRASNPLTGAIGTSGDNFHIGGGGIFDTSGNFFNGQIDEVAVWHRALNATELMGLYSAGTNPVGVAAVRFVKTDIGAAMSNVNATAYLRLPFTIDSPSSVQFLTLRVRYDDGFVAYLNGTEVARANAPSPLAYNSTATNTHSAAAVDQFQFGATVLAAGTNVLAIQGLNAAPEDLDFLISAELTATHFAAASGSAVYMTGPTPGAANGGGVSVLGPAIRDTTHSPNVPLDAQDVLVTARVTPTFAALGSVAVRYRVMFDAEIELPMFDDGTHGDVLPGDGVYSQTLPVAAVSTNGQMIRWYFRATDAMNNVSRWPLFLGAADTEYLGTIVDPTNVTSPLPIFHLFATNGVLQAPRVTPLTTQTGADSEAGGRVSLYYDGEFYDNIYMELRGNTSAGQNKKSHRLEFNRDHTFRHLPEFPRVRKTSLMAEFLDPAYIRQHLSFWLLDQMGLKSPFFYPVRAQLNGSFYGLVFHSDVIDLEQVERMGYDPSGALYKAAGNCLPSESSTGVFQKKSDPLADHSDYQALVRAINETNFPTGQATNLTLRRIAAYDRLDIPEVINYLAGARWTAENDDVWANMSLYRDTTNGTGDGLWRIIPFDMNASWGQRYGGITPLDAIADTCKSHPLYGGSTIIACDGGSYNRIYDTIIALPETRQMLLRRQRTVLDRWVMEPGVPPESRLLESHIRYMTNLIWTEAFLDRASWGYSTWTASNKPLTNAITELFSQFINLRRIHWSATHNVTNVAKPIGITPASNAGIPVSQPSQASLAITAVEFNPASSNQLQEYICVTNPNPFAVDISDWKLGHGVTFTFHPGTVVPSNSVLYVSPSIPAFRARTTGPGGGQGLFVVGPYKGQLSARGEALTLHDDSGRLVYTNNYPGNPSPPQQFLRITEIMYNPAPLAGNTNDPQQFEYLELKNISPSVTLDLNGVRFINGIDFSFTGSAITSLAPGQRVLVVRNPGAFAARYGGGLPVAGQYVGALESNGERLQLIDATGEEILDFSYNNSWYPITDGLGFSLAVVGENVEPDAWNSKTNWWPNGTLYGTPGQGNTQLPGIAPILINEVLTHTDPPLLDTVELWNPTTNDVNLGGWFLSDDFLTPKKYRIPSGSTILAGGYMTFDENVLTNPATALIPFAFRGSGDEAWLYSGDANTNLTGYVTGENFDAAASGVSFGRYTNSVGDVHFVAQSARTVGSANAAPQVGPVVISEINYHPDEAIPGVDDTMGEYIELANITGTNVALYDPAHATNTWRLRSAVDFDFPTNVTLLPGGHLIVVSFNPGETALFNTFTSRYSVPGNVRVVGPWQGQLGNTNESIRLYRPDLPDETNGVPYILVERVDYSNQLPWSALTGGIGLTLQRRLESAYGNEPTNWTGVGQSAGLSYVAGGTRPSITTEPQNVTAVGGRTATFSVGVAGTPLFSYRWSFNGSPMNPNVIPTATRPTLRLENVKPNQEGNYSCLVLNSAGSVESASASLTVLIPVSVTQQPTNFFIKVRPDPAAPPSTNATFRVDASTLNLPVTYQWLYNGTPLDRTNITGVTSNILTIGGVTTNDYGEFNVVVSDSISSVTSSTATLYPLVSPVIIQQPLSQTNVPGALVSLGVQVTGFPAPFIYEWRRASSPVPGGRSTNNSTTSVYSFLAPNLITNQQYRVVIFNLANSSPGVPSNFANVTTLLDTDGDGIPDIVEASLGLDANNQADGAGDLDGDGMSNYAEFVANTDPTNNASFLKISMSAIPGMATLSFGAAANRTYTLQYIDAFPGSHPYPWRKLADFVARPVDRTESVIDPNWTTNRFYRVAVPAVP